MKKKELGANLDRVLTLSSKRTTHTHTIKSDLGAIEFDSVFREQHINEDWIQPGEMSWSIEAFNAKRDQYEAMIEERANKKVVEAFKAHEELESKLVKDSSEGESDKLSESLKTLAQDAGQDETDITSEQANKIF